MATSFKPAGILAGTTRTLVYTCPAATQAVVFSGSLANIDNTNMLEHTITIEVQKVDLSYELVLNKIGIPYGNTLTVPKIALAAGEKVYVTSEATNSIYARFSVVEKV